jgi:hypothetical protein
MKGGRREGEKREGEKKKRREKICRWSREWTLWIGRRGIRDDGRIDEGEKGTE